jgi:Ras-related GTP-binding protein A/B
MENYFASQRDHIFKNVEVLIYVFDIESPTFHTQDMSTFSTCMDAIKQNSPTAKVFCLIHKMDLIRGTGGERTKIFDERRAGLEKIGADLNVALTCFGTSIWDETLYKVLYCKKYGHYS